MILTKQINLLIVILVLSFTAVIFCRSSGNEYREFGNPFIKYYSPKEYKAAPANWSILQDKRGVMYFGTEGQVLEFDGVSWRIIEVPFSSAVRSMAIDDSGKIYVCASSDFGYLEPDSLGRLKFKSLLGYLDKKYRDYGEMWDVITSSKAVYFKTKDKIFRWNGKNIKVWDSVYAYRLYNIDDKIYSRNQGTGLMVIDGDSLKLMPDGDYFASTGVFNILPFGKDALTGEERILVTTNGKGLFLSDGYKFYPFKTEDDSFLKTSQIYNACITSDGNFALATQRGGVIIMDRKGHFLNIINENSGMPTKVVYDVFSDKQGSLWFATNDGIVHCEVPSPLLVMPEMDPAKSPFYSMLRFKNKFYAADELGVIYLAKNNSSFDLVKGIDKPAYDLLDYHGILLAAVNNGVHVIENDKLQETLTYQSTNMILPSVFNPGRLYSFHRDGLSILKFEKPKNEFQVYQTNINEELLGGVEGPDSSLWIRCLDGGIIHVTDNLDKLVPGKINKIKFTRYSKETLPGYETRLYNIQHKILLTSNKGLYRFDKTTGNFVIDSTLGPLFADSTSNILYITKGKNNELWILADVNGSTDLGKAELQKNGKYNWHPDPVFRRLDLNTITAMYVEIDSVTNREELWISTDEGLVHFNPERTKDIKNIFPALVRRIAVNNDSVIYDGANQSIIQNNKLILPYSSNNVSFSVSSISFDKPEANRYQYYLEGNDDKWSQWTNEPKKEFTNLSSGDYTFKVRSKNVYGMISHEESISFKVSPPWYLTWWAYALYAVIFLLGIFITDRIMRRRIITKERNLAKLREAEIIKKQADELETVDRLVKVINRAENLDQLFNSLLEQTFTVIPQGEKAAVFLLDKKENLFRIAYTEGYKIKDLENLRFHPEELKRRYTQSSMEIENGIYILRNTDHLYADEKFSDFGKAESMLIMEVEIDHRTEAYVVFDSYSDKNAFDRSTARLLNRFREHAVSAISKAQAMNSLQEKNDEIIRAQTQLVHSEKMASLGELTAGIAHEIKNPLNFVNNFSDLSKELLDEIKTELENNNKEEILAILEDLKLNLERINLHGKRADSIVKGMLLHSRGTSGEKTLTDINDLLDQYVNLAYHGMRATNKEFNITIEKDYDEALEKINVVPQDISRVFLNIINNACYAAYNRKKKSGNDFSPALKVSTKTLKDKVEIRIGDNGYGIPKDIIDKIFQPFFTTKPTGEGTGLGLSLSYDIVTKMHSGELKVETKVAEGTQFIILLPYDNI